MDINAIWIKRDTYMVTKKLNNKKTVSLQITDINSGINSIFQSLAAVWWLFLLCAQVRRGRWPIGMWNRMESLDFLHLAAWPALHFKHRQPAETIDQCLMCSCINANEGLMIKYTSHCSKIDPITLLHSDCRQFKQSVDTRTCEWIWLIS